MRPPTGPAQNLYPVSERHTRAAAHVRANWPTMSRHARRSGARWAWRSRADSVPGHNFTEFWQLVNDNSGVIPA